LIAGLGDLLQQLGGQARRRVVHIDEDGEPPVVGIGHGPHPVANLTGAGACRRTVAPATLL
jgi:hypothetical protein